MAADHEKLLKVVEPQLGSKRNASRKWAIGCLGNVNVFKLPLPLRTLGCYRS